MRRILHWFGWLNCVVGAAMVGAHIAMGYVGLTPSFNLGDPAKFQFILVPLWQIGLVTVAVGGAFLLVSRSFKKTPG